MTFESDQKENLQDQIDEWQEQGVIEPSISPWALPLILVKKKDEHTLRILWIMMIPSTLSANVLNLALLSLLLLVLLYMLHSLYPPVQSFTSAGIIPNIVLRLNIAELHALGFRETN